MMRQKTKKLEITTPPAEDRIDKMMREWRASRNPARTVRVLQETRADLVRMGIIRT